MAVRRFKEVNVASDNHQVSRSTNFCVGFAERTYILPTNYCSLIFCLLRTPYGAPSSFESGKKSLAVSSKDFRTPYGALLQAGKVPYTNPGLTRLKHSAQRRFRVFFFSLHRLTYGVRRRKLNRYLTIRSVHHVHKISINITGDSNISLGAIRRAIANSGDVHCPP